MKPIGSWLNRTDQALTAAIEAVLAGGWALRPQPGRLALTDNSRDRLAEAGACVGAFRERSTAGISVKEYRTAVGVLERMTHNLEGAVRVLRPGRCAGARR